MFYENVKSMDSALKFKIDRQFQQTKFITELIGFEINN